MPITTKRIINLDNAASVANDDYIVLDGATNGTRKYLTSGKALSTEDYTTADKTKLDGIESGAQVNTVTGVKGNSEGSYRTGNVNITKDNIGLGNVDNTADADKPVSTATQTALDDKVDKVTGKGLSANDYTTAEKTKLAGIASGAEVNVQSDWTEADNTSDAYIANKPSLATVATSGDYDDLTNKPTMSVTQKTASGTNIASITLGDTTTELYAPTGGGGGVEYTAESPITIEDGVIGFNGYSVETTNTTLCEETITTATATSLGYNTSLSYATPISADSLIVAFDGTEYTCTKFTDRGLVGYGGFTEAGTDFSTYPFAIVVRSGTNYVFTESAGTYTIKIAISSETVEVSDDFTSAVSGIVSNMTQPPFKITVGTTTFNEIYSAVCTNGRFGYIETGVYANQPVYIEPVIYVLKSSSTFSVKTIGFDENALVIYTYTASSADGVITES